MASIAVKEDKNAFQSGSNINQNDATLASKISPSPKQFVVSVAANIASQSLQNFDPEVWGVLTAISNNARKRRQGINILLTMDEHCFGRVAADVDFQIESPAVSAKHCNIYRKEDIKDAEKSSNASVSVFLKDTSTNGTYLNWERLTKNGPEAALQHGDIISFAAPPQFEAAFAFVYREVIGSSLGKEGASVKRKAENLLPECKKLRGIGLGAPEGPICLDDFKSLQRSNMELRKQLEKQVVTIDELKNEARSMVERHENEARAIRESVTESFRHQLTQMQEILDCRQKEAMEASKLSVEQKHAIDDLNQRLNDSVQSCSEANEIVKSQKASIAELKVQLDEERDQRREDQEKSAADLKAMILKCQAEAKEELRQHGDAALRREQELQEVIKKLKESEKESSLQVETLVLKLEETRQKLICSDNKIRQLEAQVFEEQLVSTKRQKRLEELECETESLRKELESEKAAREEAWAKVSALDETQLRAFYSTTEEITTLFAKQQEQLKAMQKTLEDEENYENTYFDLDHNLATDNTGRAVMKDVEAKLHRANITAKEGSSTSAQGFNRRGTCTSSEDVSVTEKHDCGIMSQEGQNAYEGEFTSTECVAKGGFGSDIDAVGTEPALDGDPIGTECVYETVSPRTGGGCNHDVKKSSLCWDAMQVDDEVHAHTCGKPDQTGWDAMQVGDQVHIQASGKPDHAAPQGVCHNPDSKSSIGDKNDMDDIEDRATIRTDDLLASEVAGSWACSTAPSVHGENGSQRDFGEEDAAAIVHDSVGQADESQNRPSYAIVNKGNCERRALSEMIGIVAPDLKHFNGGKDTQWAEDMEKQYAVSDSDTEGCSNTDDNKPHDNCRLSSESDTEGSNRSEGDKRNDDTLDEDYEVNQE